MTRLLLLATGLFIALPSMAQDFDLGLRLPLTIDADQTTYDGIAGTLVYTGVRFSQGNISIQAEEGRATLREQQDAAWAFSGNVTIDVEQGRIECDAADLVFEESVLTSATVTGSPATYELRRANTNDPTYAEAGQLRYDVISGVIEFSNDVTITEAGNQISSHYLVYNINERRINADSSGNGGERVRITYTPDDLPQPEEDEDASN